MTAVKYLDKPISFMKVNWGRFLRIDQDLTSEFQVTMTLPQMSLKYQFAKKQIKVAIRWEKAFQKV